VRSIKLGLALSALVLLVPLAQEARAGETPRGPGGARPACARLWPQSRGYSYLLYDPIRRRDLLVGGYANGGWSSSLPGAGGVWAFDAAARRWSYITDLPVNGADGAVFDAREDKLIIHRPYRLNPELTTPFQLDYVSEVWVFDFKTREWTNPQPEAAPPPGLCMCGGQMTFDSRAGKVVMFGGVDLPAFERCLVEGCDDEGWLNIETNDTWLFDSRVNRWTKLPRPGDESQLPSRRNSNALTYDSNADRILLFGGGDIWGDSPPDIWALDLQHNTWTNRAPAVAPPRGEYFQMAYDRAAKRTVYFGGLQYDGASEVLLPPETWAYDYEANTWELMSPLATPDARAWHAWTWDGKTRSFVMFGGGIDRDHFTDEAWMYRLSTDTWRQVPHK
jgi:N-acetylneuraminic acid mutarotase